MMLARIQMYTEQIAGNITLSPLGFRDFHVQSFTSSTMHGINEGNKIQSYETLCPSQHSLSYEVVVRVHFLNKPHAIPQCDAPL